mmetsp:Transcript_102298/g.248673  ORF Transcript_102298/g.248673 Transcript_102298/m.248673 type:complete len:209 (+) Transcript_102298:728-1354(+)
MHGHVVHVGRARDGDRSNTTVYLRLPLEVRWRRRLERVLAVAVAQVHRRLALTGLDVHREVLRGGGASRSRHVQFVEPGGVNQCGGLLHAEMVREAVLPHLHDASVRHILDVELNRRAADIAGVATGVDSHVVVAQLSVGGRAETRIVLADEYVVAARRWLGEVLVPDVRVLDVDNARGSLAGRDVEVELGACRRIIGAVGLHADDDV